jgi:hypothetical protein
VARIPHLIDAVVAGDRGLTALDAHGEHESQGIDRIRHPNRSWQAPTPVLLKLLLQHTGSS